MKFNLQKSPIDERDFLYKNIVKIESLPEKFDRTNECSPVRDQGEFGFCYAFTGEGVKEHQEWQEWPNLKPIFSPLFLARECKAIDGVPETEGSYLRVVCKVLSEKGICYETNYPYSMYKGNLQFPEIPQSLYDEANKYKIKSYAQCLSLQEVKSAIVNQGLVMGGILVTSNFLTPENGFIDCPEGIILGNHAIRIVGYDDNLSHTYANGKTRTGFLKCANSWGCYDELTEVLTSDGFKYFKDLNGDELFATLNKNNIIEYNKATDNIKYNYNGEMYKYQSSKVDLLVTPNHNMYIKSRSENSNYKFIKAEDVNYKSFYIKRNANWLGEEKEFYNIPECSRNAKESNRNKSIGLLTLNMDYFLEFFGYWLSEGSISKSECKNGGNQYFVQISQKKEYNRKTIKDLLIKLPFNFSETEKGFVISNKQLYLFLKQFGKCDEKYIPLQFLNLSKRQLKILFDALMLGDGSIQKCETGFKTTYYTTSKILADNFQELCLKLGYTSSLFIDDRVGQQIKSSKYQYNLICYQVRIQNFKNQNDFDGNIVFNNKNKEFYNGNVYCVTVPNHLLFIRRNGKTCWCGNSEWGLQGFFFLPYDFYNGKSDYLTYFHEAWSLIDAVENVPEPIKQYWHCQTGAFKNKDYCIRLSNELRNKGFATYIVYKDGLWKVQCGAFLIKSNAENMKQKLVNAGYRDAWLTYY